MSFEENVERDARLVMAGMAGGFHAVCNCALQMSVGPYPEMKGGPDTVAKHGEWFNQKGEVYRNKVVERIVETEKTKA